MTVDRVQAIDGQTGEMFSNLISSIESKDNRGGVRSNATLTAKKWKVRVDVIAADPKPAEQVARANAHKRGATTNTPCTHVPLQIFRKGLLARSVRVAHL